MYFFLNFVIIGFINIYTDLSILFVSFSIIA